MTSRDTTPPHGAPAPSVIESIRKEVSDEIDISENNTRRLRALRQRIDLLEKNHDVVVKKLQKENDSLRAEVSELKQRVATLTARGGL